MEKGELGGDGLADDDRAGGAQPGDNGGVVPGPASSGERRTEFGRIVRGVDYVLDRDRNAVQPTERVALHAALVERPRLRKHMLAIEMRERLDLAVERFDARETGAGIGLGGNRAGGDFGGSLARGQRHKPIVGHGSAPALSPGLPADPRHASHAARPRYGSKGAWHICVLKGMPGARAGFGRERGRQGQTKVETRAALRPSSSYGWSRPAHFCSLTVMSELPYCAWVFAVRLPRRLRA